MSTSDSPDGQPEPDARKDATADAKDIASAAVSGAASAAAKSVVVGAATAGTGTLAAAGVGALKGAAVATLRSRTGRRVAAAVMVLVVLLLCAIPLGVVGVVQVTASAQQSNDSATSQESLQLDDSTTTQAAASVESTAIPWELVVVGATVFDEARPGWNAQDLDEALRAADPTGRYYDPRSGLVALGTGYREATDSDPDHDALSALYDNVEQTYLTALIDFGLTAAQAQQVWDDLQDAIRGAADCPAPASPAPDPGGDLTDPVTTLTPAQQANVQTIIGIAKAMGGDDWEQLALAALTVAYTESRWRVLANDGKIDHDYESARLEEYPASLYPIAATSMELPNEGSGSQYVALGMFQQMMNGRWGATDSSGYADDPQGAIARLMTAEWSTYAFLRAATAVEGWQTMDPAELGDTVQVSGNAAAAAANIAVGRQALEQYRDAPALPLPDGAVTPGGGGDGALNECGSGIPQAGTGEWTYPVPSGTFSSGFGDRGTVCTPSGCRGNFHNGIDISAACYAPILALDSGTVVDVSEEPLGAMQVWVDHGNGFRSRYVHMYEDGIYVSVGDNVTAGQEIAGIGSTGFSTGCHLHLELWQNEAPIDPVPLIGRGA